MRTTVRLVVIDRPNVCRIEWLTICVERLAGVAGPVLADPVEDDDRVVDAEADDGQHRGHEQGVDLDPEERAQDRERRRRRRGRRGAGRRGPSTPNFTSRKRNVIQARIPSEPTRIEQDRLLDQVLADDRADGRQGPLRVDRAERRLEGGRDLADLPVGRAGPGRCRATGSARTVPAAGAGRARSWAPGLADWRAGGGDGLADGLGAGRGDGLGWSAGGPASRSRPAERPARPTAAGLGGHGRRGRRRGRRAMRSWSGSRSSRRPSRGPRRRRCPGRRRRALTWSARHRRVLEPDLPGRAAGVVDRELQPDRAARDRRQEDEDQAGDREQERRRRRTSAACR